jgi:RNA polymerase sigma factor (sigma-70 family)
MDNLATLLEPQIPALRRYAYGLAQNSATADDLVQDCLERALSKWSSRRAEGDLKAWLFAILRNQYINTYRVQRRQGRHVTLDDAVLPGIPPNQESGLAARDALSALSSLPEEQRSVLLLVGVEDFSYEEAARTLGIPLGTVMSRLSRARQALRNVVANGRVAMLRSVK